MSSLASQRKPPCYFYAQGKCTKGSLCQFSHEGCPEPAGAQPSPAKTVPCKYFLQGTCSYGDACHYLHDPAQKVNVAKGYTSVEEQLALHSGQQQGMPGQAAMAKAQFELMQKYAMAMMAGQMPAMPGGMPAMQLAPPGGAMTLPPPFVPRGSGAAGKTNQTNADGQAPGRQGTFPPGFNGADARQRHDTSRGAGQTRQGKHGGEQPPPQKRSAFERLQGRAPERQPAAGSRAPLPRQQERQPREQRRFQRSDGDALTSASHDEDLNTDLDLLIRRKGVAAKRKAVDATSPVAKSARLDGQRASSSSEAKEEKLDFAPKPLSTIRSEKLKQHGATNSSPSKTEPPPAQRTAVDATASIPLPKSREEIRKEKAAAAAKLAATSSKEPEPVGAHDAPTSHPFNDMQSAQDLANQGDLAMRNMPEVHHEDDMDDDALDAKPAPASGVEDTDLALYEDMF